MAETPKNRVQKVVFLAEDDFRQKKKLALVDFVN